jgi:hypothetical protein
MRGSANAWQCFSESAAAARYVEKVIFITHDHSEMVDELANLLGPHPSNRLPAVG